MHTYVAEIRLRMNTEGQTMIEEHSPHSKRGIENARRGVVPEDAVLNKLIRRYFASIPDWQQENDVMPICSIISAWALAHITLYEALPMARLEAVCERNYADVTSVIHRISHNNEVVFAATCTKPLIQSSTKPPKKTVGDGDRLIMKGKISRGAHPILVPDTILDASMNFEERAHYLIDSYGLDRPVNLRRKPLFCDPFNDDLAEFYISKVEPHQDISLNICWVSLAVFYASPPKRMQIRGLVVFTLDELYHSMCDFNHNLNDNFQNPIFTRNFRHFTEPPSFDSHQFKQFKIDRGRDCDRDHDGDPSFGDYLREDP